MIATRMWRRFTVISLAVLGGIPSSDSLAVTSSLIRVHNGHRPRSACSAHIRQRTAIFSSSEGNKSLSAAGRERREEDRRRLERKTDVVIGKTSAQADAQDYAIDPTTTEQRWMQQASKVEQQVYRQTEKGLESLKMFQLEEASEAFDKVFQLRPNAYLWQAGIVKFYLDELQDAAEIFVRNIATYESKFGEPASEERIWRDACELKFASSLSKVERKILDEKGGVASMIAQIPERDDKNQLPTETRKVLRIARELFAASLEESHVAELLARAKLRSIAGVHEPGSSPRRVDRKMWKLSAWFYLGLHYDVMGDEEESKECMKMALRLCPSSGNADDIIHTLPMLHMARRDMFDDEEFDDVHDKSSESQARDESLNRGTNIRMDPLFLESMRKSVSKMRLVDIQAALKARGLKYHDSKEAVAEKLFKSLLEDSGLDS